LELFSLEEKAAHRCRVAFLFAQSSRCALQSQKKNQKIKEETMMFES